MPTTEDAGSDFTRRRAAALLSAAARDLADRGASADDLFPRHLTAVPADLAAAVRAAIARPDPTAGWSVSCGLLAGFPDPGPTPESWRKAGAHDTAQLDIAIALIAASLGRVFGWAGQQDGRLVHNIVPSPGDENLQVGSSSLTELAWHCEDSFHPRRAELLLLVCVRDDDELGSRVSSVRRAELSEPEIALLSAPSAVIVPDDSYPADWAGDDVRTATVWASPDGLCIRYDPAYTRFPEPSAELAAAYRRLGEELDRCAETVALGQGDVLLIDNDVAVHGRLPFKPRYDGTDRWLKRTMVRLPRQRPESGKGGFGQRLIEPQPAEGAR
ncbi:TauD/TfdA family dioxygenase [Actinocrinis sp.]|jgi:L-asparagine oxygenase|uniref:TauD/TfdA family dioxygenase n=1 Tax=Actinocrinis sp. TaxID=1920516 RepID=UPI002B867730|nr:TauD/TfdA family dioxygenase [Actinocrinis sp.]HXR72538.1 TauD/TfdA family dioxygenase [Actinocrinis sp.]